jgi:hypothetical protein
MVEKDKNISSKNERTRNGIKPAILDMLSDLRSSYFIFVHTDTLCQFLYI